MIYENCKIYGPYLRKDGRQHVVIIFPSGKRKTVSYPKFLMEKKLDRYLEIDETIDHIDCDISNNDLNNFRVLNRSYHASIDAKRSNDKETICIYCGKSFVVLGRKIKNRLRKKAGLFCSKYCTGRYGAEVQNGSKKFEPSCLASDYITLKEMGI